MTTPSAMPGTYANSIAFYMTRKTAAHLIEVGREMRAANMHRRAVLAARAMIYLERRTGNDRRRNGTTADMLAFADRRHKERRFERVSVVVVDIDLS